MKVSLNVEKKIQKVGFPEVLHYQDSGPTNKINDSSPRCSSRNVMFLIQFLMKEMELVVAEEEKLEY